MGCVHGSCSNDVVGDAITTVLWPAMHTHMVLAAHSLTRCGAAAHMQLVPAVGARGGPQVLGLWAMCGYTVRLTAAARWPVLVAPPVIELEGAGGVQAQVADEVERERREWRRAQARRQAEKQAKHESTARAVVRDTIGLALMYALHREQCGLDAPPKVAREWLAMFHAEDVRLRSADEQVQEHRSHA